MMQTGYNAYRQVQARTADPGQIIVMLYEGAVRFLHQASASIDAGNIENAHNNIIKASRVIEELQNSLERNQGEVAEQLFSLYQFMLRQLELANMRKDPQLVGEIAALLEDLCGAWRQAAAQAAQQIRPALVAA